MCRLPPLLPDSRHNLVVHCLMDYRLIRAGLLVLLFYQARKSIFHLVGLTSMERIRDGIGDNRRLGAVIYG